MSTGTLAIQVTEHVRRTTHVAVILLHTPDQFSTSESDTTVNAYQLVHYNVHITDILEYLL